MISSLLQTKDKGEQNLDRQEEKAILEAILFTMGESVEIERLAAVIEEDKNTTRQLLMEMKEEYDQKSGGITLIELEDSFQMCTRAEMYEYLIKIAKTPRKYVLTDTLLETLSIIAYKQPITRAEIEKIRGVSCDHAVNRLVEFGLIAEVGRMDAPGRPLLFGTTEEFLRSFGVKSLEELPELSAVQIEEFKVQAEQEASLQLDI
ncbi:MAG: SMC-Scp complex subunit ScpB [Lachnospiraceae bacterium]|nr:SMC-Scp complex subunit ScpB [Lachnospiraceae bacterium]